MKPSPYQERIYDFIKGLSGSGRIDALAGSGKTTTAINSMELLPMDVSALFVAFNKSTATELSHRIPMHAEASTFHSFGLSLFPAKKKPKVEMWKVSNMLKDAEPRKAYYLNGAVTKLVSLLKAEGYYGDVSAEEAAEVAANYGIETSAEIIELGLHLFFASREETRVIDFDDMIYMPMYYDWKIRKNDVVYVDEFQDFNRGQYDMLLKMADLIYTFGDENQGIYRFRGAYSGIMDEFAKTTGAKRLPLNICYRCDKAIIAEAQKYVPEIQARDNAPDGIVGEMKMEAFLDWMEPGDFGLCRTNEPLVRTCLNYIRQGKRAMVRGKEIGKQLTQITKKAKSEDTFYDDIYKFQAEEVDRLSKQRNSEDKIAGLHDRVSTIFAVAEAVRSTNVREIDKMIDSLFTDSNDKNCRMLMTVHKAKGLEAPRVAILPSKSVKIKCDEDAQQERNIKYVAATRAQRELYYVQP